MDYRFSSCSHIGMRQNNEDAFAVRPLGNTLLAVVADGLGGHENGEVASNLAVAAIFEALQNAPFEEDSLLNAIWQASNTICRSEHSGHTTVAALWLKDGMAIAAHVGDSRIYHFRNGQILFQSTDHSSVQIGVLVGELPPEALRLHPDRNKLFRVLGLRGETPKIDLRKLSVLPGDRFLLCSDGFWEHVWEADMQHAMAVTETPEQWLSAMVQRVAGARDPHQDNCTAICIHTC